jgi:hypothetical protein
MTNGEIDRMVDAGLDRAENAALAPAGPAASTPAADAKAGAGGKSKGKLSSLERLKQMALDDEEVIFPAPAAAAASTEPAAPGDSPAPGSGVEDDSRCLPWSTPARGGPSAAPIGAADPAAAAEISPPPALRSDGIGPTAQDASGVGSTPGAKAPDGTQAWDLAIKFDFMVRRPRPCLASLASAICR